MLALLGQQLTHEEIGRRLFISVRTVESHVASLRRKLALPDHRSLVRYAVVYGDAAGSGRSGLGAFAPLTSFVGRAHELSALQTAVREARAVTAIGPGGVGKTVAAARDLARAAAVAKCRVNGDDALRLELAAAARAADVGDDRLQALALARAVELLNRFPGIFAHLPPSGAVAEFAETAHRLGGDDPLVAATLAVGASGYAAPPGTSPSAPAAAALDAARRSGTPS